VTAQETPSRVRFRPSPLQAFRHSPEGELTYAAPRNDFNLLTPELGVPQPYEIGAKRNNPTSACTRGLQLLVRAEIIPRNAYLQDALSLVRTAKWCLVGKARPHNHPSRAAGRAPASFAGAEQPSTCRSHDTTMTAVVVTVLIAVPAAIISEAKVSRFSTFPFPYQSTTRLPL
jgi:hypothetical protein